MVLERRAVLSKRPSASICSRSPVRLACFAVHFYYTGSLPKQRSLFQGNFAFRVEPWPPP